MGVYLYLFFVFKYRYHSICEHLVKVIIQRIRQYPHEQDGHVMIKIRSRRFL